MNKVVTQSWRPYFLKKRKNKSYFKGLAGKKRKIGALLAKYARISLVKFLFTLLFLFSLQILANAPFLSDQQQILSQQYINEPHVQEILSNLCEAKELNQGEYKNLKDDFCSQDSVDQVASVFGARGDQLMQVVSTMYAMFFGSGDTKIKRKNLKATATTSPAKSSPESPEELTDWCAKIPMATQAVAKVAQQSIVAITPFSQQGNHHLKQSLIDVSTLHQGRRVSALMESSGYASTATCYGGYIAAGGYIDKKAWMKMGASIFLGSYTGAKAKKHQKYKKSLEYVASQLPGKGACNPVTDNRCYCAYPQHQKTPYCNDADFLKAARSGQILLSCINQQGQVDPQCQCLHSQSCINRHYQDFTQQISMEDYSDIGSHFSRTLPPTTNGGKLSFAKLQHTTPRQLAMAQAFINENENLIPIEESPTLSPKEQQIAHILKTGGVPTPLLASLSQEIKKNLSPQKSFPQQNKRLSLTQKTTSPQYKKNRQSSRNSLSLHDDNYDSKQLLNSIKKTTSPSNTGNKVLHFKKEALKRNADINQSPYSIFKIISARYSNKLFYLVSP